SVTGRVRSLRQERRLTQQALAGQLGLSQGRLSEIERGDGSFTAEQLLLLLRLFNVPASHFLPPSRDEGAALQNALIRLGATHLQRAEDTAPDDRFDDVPTVVREVLLTPAPRHVTALAAVLVCHLDRVNLRKLRADFAEAGLDRRLGWLLDNIRAAVREALSAPRSRAVARRYRRAEVLLDAHAEQHPPPADVAPDLLDPTITSARTKREVEAASSAISRRWGIITDLQPADFTDALRAADGEP
ncbi:MAG: helix-turn-helix transcriptional regulator, partial [Byssovorax sp.]